MQLYPLRLFSDSTSFNFIRFGKFTLLLSILISIICVFHITYFGFNFGIDFAGGASIEVRSSTALDISHVRLALSKLNIGEISIQSFGDENTFTIRIASDVEHDLMNKIELIKSSLSKAFSQALDYRKVDFVGPQVGQQLVMSGIVALALSLVGIMIYIGIRFEWYFGIGVLIALAHDVLYSIGLMSITRLDFNLSTVAAILTIVGYSVNDSVVIYDRIRENLRKYHKKNMIDIINLSVNETLSRTTFTVFTTLLACLALVLFGGEAIHSFSVLVFCGILIGTYSSIFISAPVLLFFYKKNTKVL